MAFPQGLLAWGATPGRGWDGRAHPNRRRAVPGTPKGRVAPGHGLEARIGIGESGGRGTTPSDPATWRKMYGAQRSDVPVHNDPDVRRTPLDRHRERRNPPPYHGLPLDH